MSSLTAERVRRDVDVVARAGLGIDDFLDESVASLSRAVPFVSACLATVDPSTRLLTGTWKYGDLLGRNELDHEFALMEYGEHEPTAFTAMAGSGVDAAGVHLVTSGKTELSPRVSQFMTPNFGYTDELRTVCRLGDRVWGAIALFRESDSPSFTETEVDFMASLTEVLAVGLRSGMLATLAGSTAHAAATGPAVIIVGGDNSIRQTSLGADERLADLFFGQSSGAPVALVAALVSAARRFARGETTVPPRTRVRGASGMWLVLHASPLTALGEHDGDVVITIEEARPPEIVPLVVAAFDLTPRERDVTQLVLQGVDTKAIAQAMHVSTYTVQDHLKAVFDKAGVRSRRELISLIYFDQYVPRMGSELGPSGWFTS
ncbi:helix-turn-helix transcriptional regulator [Nocardioides KLBMP 9356]|uniref:Helix-turn-helix transcriptional regulator n=1 Tax=Nocardioides potassii TaxID=2911371 RepID=A0ABS9H9S4_9ACTN|nr:helix-turn-helix transcriptional regulator [Nocardioides potassii]MCF6377970.1 helix-turn-helix transcriptional regulator [Nocardioides potassii]